MVKLSPRKKKWITNALQLMVLAIVFFSIRVYMQGDMIRGQAPLIEGMLLDGTPVSPEQFVGKPRLIYFWATWCPICRAEIGAINALAQDYAVLSVAMQSGSEQEVMQYVREYDVRYPVLVDEQGLWASRYGVRGVPASFVVDAQGNVAFIEVGYTTQWGLRLRLWWANW